MINLNGSNLRIATIHQPPHVSLNTEGSVTKFIDGYEVEILKIISQVFNFTYSLIDCNLNWGTLLPNKTWSGLIGQLAQNHADIGFCELSMTFNRFEAVQFSYPYSVERITYITSAPKVSRTIGFIYRVFENDIWITTLFSYLLYLALYYFGKVFLGGMIKINFDWVLIQVLLNQNMTFKGLSLRPYTSFLLYSWILTCTFLTLIYSNCLYTFMVLPDEYNLLETIQLLFEAQIKGRITVKIRERTSSYGLLQQSNIDIYRGIFEHAHVLTYKDVFGIETIPNSVNRTAFIGSEDFINYHIGNFDDASYYKPRATEESTFFIEFTTFGFSNQFKYKNHFNELLKLLLRTGIIEFWMKRYRVGHDQFQHFSTRIVDRLKLFDHNHFVLYSHILYIGYSIASILLIFELTILKLRYFIL